jgi:16S rRNA (cytosine1402-N4)-methyltransferase
LDVQTVPAFGGRPARVHPPIMLQEALRCLRPCAGDVAIDCTLGGGGHAQAIMDRLQPGGRLIGLDIDPLELPHTEARLRAAGYGPELFIARQASFASCPICSPRRASPRLI